MTTIVRIGSKPPPPPTNNAAIKESNTQYTVEVIGNDSLTNEEILSILSEHLSRDE